MLSYNFYGSEIQAQFSWAQFSVSYKAEIKRSVRLYSHLKVLGKHLFLSSLRLLAEFISLGLYVLGPHFLASCQSGITLSFQCYS